MQQIDSVFHEGERSLHEMQNTEHQQHKLGLRMTPNDKPNQHREAFNTLKSVHIDAVQNDTLSRPSLRATLHSVTRAEDAQPIRCNFNAAPNRNSEISG